MFWVMSKRICYDQEKRIIALPFASKSSQQQLEQAEMLGYRPRKPQAVEAKASP